MQSYLNLDLQIVPVAQGYRAQVISSPVGQATVLITLPFSQQELQQPLDMLGGAVRHLRPVGDAQNAGGATGVSSALGPKELGARFFAAVMRDEIVVCLRRSLDAARRDEAGLRIRLRLTDAPELAALPWEYLFDPSRDQFLALVDELSIVRYLDLPEPEPVLPVVPPLRVLAVLSDPVDIVPRLDVGREWALLQEAIAGLGADQVLLDRLPAATLDSLRQRLGEKEVHVLHFIGHGWFDAGGNGLVCEEMDGRGVKVPADVLGVLLRGQRALRLLFLNACEGARADNAAAFSGVAQLLVRQGVPAVIAMQFPITDTAAIRLSQSFYSALARGASVDAALTAARQAVYTAGSLLEWGTPVFFSRSADNRILALPDSTPAKLAPEAPRKAFEPETVLIAAGPFRMGSAPGEGIPAAETPPHEVTLPAYRIGKYPVTVREFAAFVKATKAVDWVSSAREAGWFNLEPPKEKLDHPVTGVSWHDAAAYCAWLAEKDVTGRHYRLPSEAEWEKAARGIDGRRYPWGDDWRDGCVHAAAVGNAPAQTAPVLLRSADGSGGVTPARPGGASPYGCVEMLGNVQEWTRSLWGSRPQAPDFAYPYAGDDGAGEDGREIDAPGDLPAQMRLVQRGGSFKSQAGELRCAQRGHADPTSRISWRGFRVAMKIAGKE